MKKYLIPSAIIIVTACLFFAFKFALPPRQTLGIESTADMQGFVGVDKQIFFRESDATWGDMTWLEAWLYDANSTATPSSTVIKPTSVTNGRYIKWAFEVPAQSFSSLTGKPTTLSGYGISDAYPLSGNPSGYLTSVPAQSFSSLTGKPNSLAGYGITDAYPLSGNPSGFLTSIPAAPGNNNASGYGTGTAYTLTTTSAKVTFGTTSPSITIPAAGTYLIFPNIKLEYVGLTLAVTRTAAFKLRRTNNTAADLSNATANFNAPAIAIAQNGTAGDVDINPIIYTTSNNNDVVEIWGSISGATLTGTMQVGDASIIAIRIY